MKAVLTTPFYNRQTPHFLLENLDPAPFHDFSKISPPINRGFHTVNIVYTKVFSDIYCPNCEAA